MAAEDRVHAVVDPIIDDLQLELVDLVYAGGRLKITIDHPDGLNTELLTKATRMISHEIDLQDPINGAFTLEVSSPGVERELRIPAHYNRSIGEQVAIKLAPNTDNLRRIKGELTTVGDDGITIINDDGEHELSFAQIAKAKTVFEWGPAPKPGGKKNTKGGSNTSTTAKKNASASADKTSADKTSAPKNAQPSKTNKAASGGTSNPKGSDS